MRTLLATLILGCALTANPLGVGSAHAGVAQIKKLAVVDVQRVILETAHGKRAKKELEKTFAKNNAKLERKAKELQQQLEDLQAKAAMLSEAEVLRRQQELMRKDAELQELYMKSQEELASKEALLTEKIYDNVAAIVKQMALEESLQVVLVRSSSTVLYANPKLDLTNKVIVVYDKKHQ
jgi:outer membrane protein